MCSEAPLVKAHHQQGKPAGFWLQVFWFVGRHRQQRSAVPAKPRGAALQNRCCCCHSTQVGCRQTGPKLLLVAGKVRHQAGQQAAEPGDGAIVLQRAAAVVEAVHAGEQVLGLAPGPGLSHGAPQGRASEATLAYSCSLLELAAQHLRSCCGDLESGEKSTRANEIRPASWQCWLCWLCWLLRWRPARGRPATSGLSSLTRSYLITYQIRHDALTSIYMLFFPPGGLLEGRKQGAAAAQVRAIARQSSMLCTCMQCLHVGSLLRADC